MNWINVQEKLPKESRIIVAYEICYPNGVHESIVTIAGYGLRLNDEADGGPRWEPHFYELDLLYPVNCWIDLVSHWMPLPIAPSRLPQVSARLDESQKHGNA